MLSCHCARHLTPLHTLDDVNQRCADINDILKTCELVERGNWNSLHRCRVCGRFWIVEYPFGERHGGGPSCAYNTNIAQIPKEPVTLVIRQRDEDRAFLNRLGPEIGPDKCRIQSCLRLRIRNSVFCAANHFESITDRRIQMIRSRWFTAISQLFIPIDPAGGFRIASHHAPPPAHTHPIRGYRTESNDSGNH